MPEPDDEMTLVCMPSKVIERLVEMGRSDIHVPEQEATCATCGCLVRVGDDSADLAATARIICLLCMREEAPGAIPMITERTRAAIEAQGRDALNAVVERVTTMPISEHPEVDVVERLQGDE